MILNWLYNTYAKRSFTFEIFAWLGHICIWDNQKWLLQKTGCDHGVKIKFTQASFLAKIQTNPSLTNLCF